jgi:hypothetical protein
VLAGTAYSDLHAFDRRTAWSRASRRSTAAAGRSSPAGWTVVAPAAGSFTGAGTREVASTTREGNLFVWKTTAKACDPASWREWGHDGWNSANSTLDAIRPARIADLAATRDRLSFTAVGDDGRCGRAALYEVRASGSPITAQNFAQATVVQGAPAPAAPGTAESFAVTLPAGTRFVAVRTLDADPATSSAVQPVNPSAIAVAALPGVPAPPAPTVPTTPPAPTTPAPEARPIAPACPDDRVPRGSREDIAGNTHERAIDCMIWYEIARGTSDRLYGPSTPVRRDQMAASWRG